MLLLVGLGAIVVGMRRRSKKIFVYSLSSFGFCMASLLSQFLEIQRLMYNGDISAVLDLIDTIIKLAVFLSLTTLILNIIAYVRCKK